MSDTQPGAGGRAPYPFGEITFAGFSGLSENFWPVMIRLMLPYMLLSLAVSSISFLYLGDYMQATMGMAGASDAEIMQSLAKLGGFALIWLLQVLLAVFLFSSALNAAYRFYLNRDLGGMIGALRFGGGEFRTLVLLLAFYLFIYAVPYLIFIIAALVTGIAMAGAGAADNASPMITGLIGIAFLLLFFIFIVFFSVRLSMCVPASVDREKYTFWDSMRLTKKRGWPLLGSYLVLGLIWGAVMFFFIIIVEVSLLGTMMPLILQAENGGISDDEMARQMAELFTSGNLLVPMVIIMVIGSFVSGLGTLLFAGLRAKALRFLQEDKGDRVADLEVFD